MKKICEVCVRRALVMVYGHTTHGSYRMCLGCVANERLNGGTVKVTDIPRSFYEKRPQAA